MHVWNVLHAARCKYRTQKYVKIAICAPSHKGMYRQSEKLVKQRYRLHMSSQYGELRPTNGWDLLVGFEHPSKFQRVLRLGFGTAPTSLNRSQPNFERCLAVFCAGTLCIHFWRLLSPDGISPGAKFTMHPSLAFSYIVSVTTQHSSSGVSQILRRGIFTRQCGHPVRH